MLTGLHSVSIASSFTRDFLVPSQSQPERCSDDALSTSPFDRWLLGDL